MSGLKPTNITANRIVTVFTVNWSDGHVSHYPFDLLRHACPCAECRGGHENMNALPAPAVFDLPEEDSPATRLRNIESVGSYAISPEWEDGHHYGIYRWDYLRALCPCPACRKVQQD
jgi:DUF971 family protein